MKEETISKKELLELTGITYGQLYRWKRKNLIPEQWFIKKASFTGQETFFPKEKILERVSKIIELKDDFSLDELANQFSPQVNNVNMGKRELLERNIVTFNVYQMYEAILPEHVSFGDILGLVLCEEQLKNGVITTEEGKGLLHFLQTNQTLLNEKAFRLLFIRKYGIGIWNMVEVNCVNVFDEEAKIVLNIDLQPYIERIQLNK
ncbi:MAG: DUF4004 family protein [Bacillaceae bacterium]